MSTIKLIWYSICKKKKVAIPYLCTSLNQPVKMISCFVQKTSIYILKRMKSGFNHHVLWFADLKSNHDVTINCVRIFHFQSISCSILLTFFFSIFQVLYTMVVLNVHVFLLSRPNGVVQILRWSRVLFWAKTANISVKLGC